jgi:hypothetical protein
MGILKSLFWPDSKMNQCTEPTPETRLRRYQSRLSVNDYLLQRQAVGIELKKQWHERFAKRAAAAARSAARRQTATLVAPCPCCGRSAARVKRIRPAKGASRVAYPAY